MRTNKILIISILTLLFSSGFASAKEISGVIEGAIVVGVPVSNIASGSYSSIQYVELKSSGVREIRYSTKEDVLTCSSGELYTKPISIDRSLILRAISCYESGINSEVSEFKYEINLPKQSGGGNGASGSFPTKNAISKGEVLGAFDSSGVCEKYLFTPIVFGIKNNKDDVVRLQKFLNRELNVNIPLTGYYGKITRSYVVDFQDKYHDEILGKEYKGGGTGNVYQMTMKMIDKIECLRTTQTAKNN